MIQAPVEGIFSHGRSLSFRKLGPAPSLHLAARSEESACAPHNRPIAAGWAGRRPRRNGASAKTHAHYGPDQCAIRLQDFKNMFPEGRRSNISNGSINSPLLRRGARVNHTRSTDIKAFGRLAIDGHDV